MAGGPLAGPLPDIAIISGRRAIPHARALKKASAGRTKIVILKDPRAGRAVADALWAPAHDRVAGDNVIATLTSPHGLSAALTGAGPSCAAIAKLPKRFLGVVLGGPAGGADYSAEAASDLAKRINLAAGEYAAIAVTPSRRTPPQFLNALKASLKHNHIFIWSGEGENPYRDIVGGAATLIVAGDSHNMVSEALASRAGVYIWRPKGVAVKMGWFIDQLASRGDAKEFTETAPAYDRQPLDATPEIVAAIKQLLGL